MTTEADRILALAAGPWHGDYYRKLADLAPVVAEQVKALEAQLADANGRIEEALALHERHKTFEWCRHDPQRQWPCPTVQALTSETEASDV